MPKPIVWFNKEDSAKYAFFIIPECATSAAPIPKPNGLFKIKLMASIVIFPLSAELASLPVKVPINTSEIKGYGIEMKYMITDTKANMKINFKIYIGFCL